MPVYSKPKLLATVHGRDWLVRVARGRKRHKIGPKSGCIAAPTIPAKILERPL